MAMQEKSNNFFKYIFLLIIPTLLLIYTFSLTNYFFLSLEISFLTVYFIFILYFTKDLFTPFIFFFINIFLGIVDIYFVAIKLRNVVSYYPMSIYEKTLFLIILWLVMFLLGYKIRIKKNKISTNYNLKINNVKTLNHSFIIISTLFLMFLLFKVLLTIKKVGSISMNLEFFEGQAFLIAMFPLCGFIPVCLLEENKKKMAIIASIVIFLTISLTGRRYVAIITTIFPLLVYYHYKVKKIKVKNLMLLAIPVVIFIMIVGRIRMQNNYRIYNENTFLNTAIMMGKYIQYGENIPDLVYSIDSNKICYQGFKYSLRGFIGIIPRKIWNNKPEVDYSNITSQLVYGYDRGYGQPVGQFGWAYLCFGYVGVVLSGFLTGFISRKFYYWMLKRKTAYSIAIYSLMIMQVINIFTPDSQMKIILFMFYIVIVNIVNLIKSSRWYDKNEKNFNSRCKH